MSAAAETEAPAVVEVLTADRTGSDFMVDVLKSLGFEYVCANPGSSFRGLHESIINYGGNKSPEFITCCHEESSVAMAHGYFKVEGKPMAVLAHGTVGLQHAAMAIYNAYCDRVPVISSLGNTIDATHAAARRRVGAQRAGRGGDGPRLHRSGTTCPISLQHFAESAVRAYKIAMTPPMMPVLLVADGDLQEDSDLSRMPRLRIPKLTTRHRRRRAMRARSPKRRACSSPPRIRSSSPTALARTPAGMRALVELAETLQAPVVDQGGRMNFPTRHPLNQIATARARLIADADVILGLELADFWGTVSTVPRSARAHVAVRSRRPTRSSSASRPAICSSKRNYQDFQRYPEVDLAMAADARSDAAGADRGRASG